MMASEPASTAEALEAADVAIAIMAKRPEVGWTKTRLSPPLAPDEAVELYGALLRDTIRLVSSFDRVQLAIAVTPPDAVDEFGQWTPPNALLLPVEGPDIGECLSQALSKLLGAGYRAAFAINSDGPSLPREYVLDAMRRIHDADVVLGPSEDGGYYLIGMKSHYPGLFQGVAWSTDLVTAQTERRANTLGLRVERLPQWYDVDTAADLDRLVSELTVLPADELPHTRLLTWLETYNRLQASGIGGNPPPAPLRAGR